MCTHTQRHTATATLSVWPAACGNEWVMYRQRWTPCPPQTSHTQGDNYNQQRCRERNTGGGRGTTFFSWKMSKWKPGHSASTPAACAVLPMPNLERETRHIHRHLKSFSYCRILAEEKSMGSAWSCRSGGPQRSSRGNSGVHKNMYVFYLHLNSSRFCCPSTSLTGC